ncbi:dihydrofolate reductase family protein [Variovorax sp. KK3]|uniref:dihydrofolate reductase family protein n=2 Tax=Variovorax sp. KK3 TaxID=1855728 RepID=UPI003AAF60AC
MRKLIASTMLSLDGIMQAPGGPEEDPSGGFAFGGWTFPHFDESMGDNMHGLDAKDRELLLGRRTYEIFEAYWPYQSDDNPIAKTFNATRKHVVSRSLTQDKLQWANSTLLPDDIVAAITALKAQPGKDLQIIGSGNLIQTLQGAGLIDEYNTFTFPVVLGRGKRLFEAGAKPGGLKLVGSETSKTGVVMSTYVPAGEVVVGSFAEEVPSGREIERRNKWGREAG